MSETKRSAADIVLDALASQSEVTVSELATVAGLGRSTVGKTLVGLEQAGRVRRSPGGRDGARRLPDRWTAIDQEPSSVAPVEQDATAPEPEKESGAQRLRPGQLDHLVLDYLHAHAADGPVSPTTVAKGLGRSSGAVGNCLARLAGAGGQPTAAALQRHVSIRTVPPTLEKGVVSKSETQMGNDARTRRLRAGLVQRLRAGGHLADERVAGAFALVPRHLFVSGVEVEQAYRDEALPVKRDRSGRPVSSSSQLAIMAIMLAQLDLRAGQRGAGDRDGHRLQRRAAGLPHRPGAELA